MREYAIPVLRAGLVILFLWFGFSQVMDPAGWTAWVPEWPTALTGLTAENIVFLNGLFEVVLGLALLLGIWTRYVATLLGLHLLLVAYEVGYNDIGVRDFALAITCFALALWGDDRFGLLSFLKKRETF